LRVLRVAFLSALALEIVATLSTAVVAVEVGLRLLYGRLAFEPALAILLLAPEFYLPLRLLGTRFHAGTTGATAASRIFEVLDIPAHPGRVRDGHDDIPPGASFHWSTIAFEGVCFSYPGEPEVLKSATFHLSAGERLALTGPSGAGKSTIASLLLRFIEAQAGQITVDGRNITEIPRETWLSQVSWVPQAPYLFHDSIAANIWMARPSASPEDVISAIRLAGAEEFIRQLPQGLETVVGERGLRLSGGQAQRIALARAFLKDAPLLILDEATANLDPDLEMQIHLATTRLMVGRTVLIITHRPPTFANLDRILYLQEGRIQESSPSAIDDLPEQAYLSTEPDLPGQFTPRPDSSVSRPTGGSEEIPTTPGTEAGASLPRQGSILWRLLRFISPYKKWVALSAMLGSATIGSAIGLMVTSAFIISAAALHPSIAVLETAIVGVRFFGISRGIFRYLERLVTHDITLRLLAQLRVWFYRSLEPLAPARLLLQRSGDLLSRAISDINTLENFYVRAVSPPLVAIIVAISASAILASYASVLGAMLLVMILAAGVGLPILLYLLTRKPGRQVITQRAALNHVLVDGLQGMADLQVFGQEGHQLEKVIALGDSLAQSQMRLGSVASLQTAANLLLANLAAWLTLVLAIPFVVEGRIAGVYLAGLVLISLTSFEAVALLPQAAQQLESCLQAAHRLFELVDARPEVQEPENPLPVPREFHLALHNLEFRYPHPLREAFNPLIIEGVTFELAAGQQVAIVGPSGAGKSTIVNLLLRFWEYGELNDPQDNAGVVHHDGQSSILLNGKALRSYSPNALRQEMAVVPQYIHLFNTTIRENLLVACPSASQEALEQAAQQAQAHDFIQSLPQGYDTWIGEQGLRLSGGERQRIAIARALLKEAPLLILDEPLAHLDAQTARAVLKALLNGSSLAGSSRRRALLMITHRLVNLEAMDEILVMSRGRIVERGKHAELLQKDGYYRRMWDLQRVR
jgi:ATP-binding cassette subfamily C protein CydCD